MLITARDKGQVPAHMEIIRLVPYGRKPNNKIRKILNLHYVQPKLKVTVLF